jgi:hypothetical protein
MFCVVHVLDSWVIVSVDKEYYHNQDFQAFLYLYDKPE